MYIKYYSRVKIFSEVMIYLIIFRFKKLEKIILHIHAAKLRIVACDWISLNFSLWEIFLQQSTNYSFPFILKLGVFIDICYPHSLEGFNIGYGLRKSNKGEKITLHLK